uniref:(northern house mosquito) hypothetical protein n=1 Tax=Culex pipiens TaxID=7175 RepID=A0A8D8A371_CULPI
MKEHGFTLDGPTASMKFRNMQKTYKVNKLRQSITGQGADCVNWPYFEQFEAICGKQVKFTIPVETLGGSLPTDETNKQDPVLQENNEAIPNLKRGLTLHAYRKAKVGLATAKLELMERHNKDKLQLERERTEALKASEQSKLELLKSYFDKNQK